MKTTAAFIFSFLMIGHSAFATSSPEETLGRGYDGSAYIFVEGGVEFSVFPDGQFDFVYVGGNSGSTVSVSVGSPNVNISFNSGHDYEMYVQYDDYGAVIQVENVPIYYDEYGRISQAGNVDIHYNDRRIVRVGGLHVFYDHHGYFSHYSGFINAYNPYYVYRPWHVYYARPLFSHCIVYDYPYRRYYSPHRYSWHMHRDYYKNRHRVAYSNGRRDFYRPGSRVHYKNGRTAKNKNFDPNRRNTAVLASNDRSQNIRSNQNTTRANSTKTTVRRDGDSKVRTNTQRNDRNIKTENVRTSRTVQNNPRNVATKTERTTSVSKQNPRVSQKKTVKRETRVQPQRNQNNDRSVSTRATETVKRNTTVSPTKQRTVRKSSPRANTAVNKSSGSSRGNSNAVRRGGRG